AARTPLIFEETPRMNSFRPFLIAIAAALLAGACATPRVKVPAPLPLPAQDNHEQGFQQAESNTRQDMHRSGTPAIPGGGDNTLVAGINGEALPPLKGGAVNVNIEGMPVPAFIH